MRKAIIATMILAAMAADLHATNLSKLGRDSVLRSLKDPESARFRDTFINNGALCGYVNAKNSYGGYAGFSRFISNEISAIFEKTDDDHGVFETMWRESCWSKEKLAAYQRQNEAEIPAETMQLIAKTALDLNCKIDGKAKQTFRMGDFESYQVKCKGGRKISMNCNADGCSPD